MSRPKTRKEELLEKMQKNWKKTKPRLIGNIRRTQGLAAMSVPPRSDARPYRCCLCAKPVYEGARKITDERPNRTETYFIGQDCYDRLMSPLIKSN